MCMNEDKNYLALEKFSSMKAIGAVGMIVVDNNLRQVASKFGVNPIASVNEDDGHEIQTYINSESHPVATILPTRVIANYKPAPVVGYFSSRGPTYGIPNLIKVQHFSASGLSISILQQRAENGKCGAAGHCSTRGVDPGSMAFTRQGGGPPGERSPPLRHTLGHLHGLPSCLRPSCQCQVSASYMAGVCYQISHNDIRFGLISFSTNQTNTSTVRLVIMS